jgi:predicted ester cyclase
LHVGWTYRRKNKKTTDLTAYHQTHIDRWNQFEANRMPDKAMHNRQEFDAYLAWLTRNYRLALRLSWTLANIADDPTGVEEQNKYDTSTRRGSTVGAGPV